MTMLFSEAEMRGYWPWPQLQAGAYDFIMADPPWTFTLWSPSDSPAGSRPEGDGHAAPAVLPAAYKKSPQAQYATMTLADIARLPVAGLAAEHCVLWLWATAPLLAEQIGVLEAWGFAFKTSGVWVKTTRHGKIAFGTGYILRNAHEPFLIGTRGDPTCTRAVRSVVMGGVREHSRKPEEAYAAAEKLMPDARRVELFSRTNRHGWDVWGDEVGKFNAPSGRLAERGCAWASEAQRESESEGATREGD